MRRPRWLVLVLPVLLAPALAAAQTADVGTCQGMAGEKAVAACTRLIGSGKYKGRDQLYELYNLRGGAFAGIQDHESAVADFTRAIERDKGRPHAFINRAGSRALLGNLDGAIADYTATLAVTGNREFRKGALNNRGNLYRQKGDLDRAIADLDAAIALDAHFADALLNRAELRRQKGEYELAIVDYGKLIERHPRTAFYYDKRAAVREAMGDLDGAIADLGAAIGLAPGSTRELLVGRANLYFKMRRYDRAIDDYTRLIGIDPKFADFYGARAWCHHLRGRYDLAIEDAGKAIQLGGKKANIYHTRGEAYLALRRFQEAIADFDRALAIEPRHFDSTAGRGEAHEAKGDPARAIEDYKAALGLPARSSEQKARQAELAKRLAALQAPPPPVPAVRPPDVASLPRVSLGRRVALVIGNAAYKVGPLENPVNDATAMAEVLDKRLGFDKVILERDLSYRGFRRALRDFSRDASGAGLALFYYAGHATERGGKNYLVPVDARLESAGDLGLETVQLETVLEQLDGATKLKLVILDACRNNVFPLAGAERNVVSRGLVRVEPERNTLVVYAAKEGTTALDTVGRKHSPFTEALLKRIATRDLEVRFLFGQVRDDVLAATGNRQEPHTYGTLGGAMIFLQP